MKSKPSRAIRLARWVVTALASAVLGVGCASGSQGIAPAVLSSAPTSNSASTASDAIQTPATEPTVPSFEFQVRPLTTPEQEAMIGVSWNPGCPVELSELRHIELTHWGFDQQVHRGVLVMHAEAAEPMRQVFTQLYAAQFPIRSMIPIEAFNGDDFESIEADNTSSFNCRTATRSEHWSRHSYGLAIDINPIENPYLFNGERTTHDASWPYLDRDNIRPGMAVESSVLVAAFDEVGWHWGGRWVGNVDIQHFSDDNT